MKFFIPIGIKFFCVRHPRRGGGPDIQPENHVLVQTGIKPNWHIIRKRQPLSYSFLKLKTFIPMKCSSHPRRWRWFSTFTGVLFRGEKQNNGRGTSDTINIYRSGLNFSVFVTPSQAGGQTFHRKIMSSCKRGSNQIDIKNHLLFISLITVFLVCSCFPPSVSPKAKPIIVDQATLKLSPDGKTLQGTGRVLFNQPLFGLYSRELYFVKVEFLHPHSFFILHSHLSDFSKQDGIKVLLRRENNDLILYASTPDQKTQRLGVEPDYFLGNQKLALYIEIENGTENLVNIAVWNFYVNPRGNLKTPSLLFSRQNQLTLSSDPLFHSKGQGILWGAELNDIRLIEISRESPNISTGVEF